MNTRCNTLQPLLSSIHGINHPYAALWVFLLDVTMAIKLLSVSTNQIVVCNGAGMLIKTHLGPWNNKELLDLRLIFEK